MATKTEQKTEQSAGEILKTLQPGPFLTLESRLARGGSLQARKLSAGAIQFYWRYSHEGKTSREPIGVYDPLAPPKKDQPTVKGYSIAAALRKCDEFALVHTERANSGGLQQAKVEERKKFEARKTAEVAKHERTLGKLLEAYVAHLKAQGRRSWYDAENIFRSHIEQAWPAMWSTAASEVTPDQMLDVQRKLIEHGKGRTSNKLRSYARAAYQCAVDVRTDASIPIVFKDFAIVFNPAAQTKRVGKFDRADKRPLTAEDLRAYWALIKRQEGIQGAALRLHLLAGGQRIEQLLRLAWADVADDAVTIFDGKGRPGQEARPHTLPLVKEAAATLGKMPRDGEYVISTTQGRKPVSATTIATWAHDIVGDSIAGFQLKRIRSGVETLLAANQVSREIRGHLQSHGQTGVQARHYDGHDYMREKRAALELLFQLLEPKPAEKVVPIRKKRA